MTTGRQLGPPSDYREPGDVCASCRERWATQTVIDMTGVFDGDHVCDSCADRVPDEYVLLPYVPPSLDDGRN